MKNPLSHSTATNIHQPKPAWHVIGAMPRTLGTEHHRLIVA